ncbi:uncharacterized protein B0J16DRAFT_326499 [Fusarium flagelliforme]|uniref:uncharacterized protein n=1 Tax=Fusarium flagelliforme TaxID=2675880 RepID=UPI001E8D1436|nr:uncharacterized protein B0J16DRAFT_326499 [Fusarium flagelliforme]KAH7196721.1 hypothetical protein B0J16DRAFT_326499 [Fusarium flagelliforme]
MVLVSLPLLFLEIRISCFAQPPTGQCSPAVCSLDNAPQCEVVRLSVFALPAGCPCFGASGANPSLGFPSPPVSRDSDSYSGGWN